MGPLKDSIRESIRFQINMLMEHGLEFKVKKNSTLDRLIKERKI